MHFANVLVLSFILALANSAGNECDKADKECNSEHEKSKYSKGMCNYRKYCFDVGHSEKKNMCAINMINFSHSLVPFFCSR